MDNPDKYKLTLFQKYNNFYDIITITTITNTIMYFYSEKTKKLFKSAKNFSGLTATVCIYS